MHKVWLIFTIIILIIIIPGQCWWCCHHSQSHYESSPGSFVECRLSAMWSPTLRPSQPTWAMSPPVGCYHTVHIMITIYYYYLARKLILFYRPTEGGRLSRPRHCSKSVQPVPKAVYLNGCGRLRPASRHVGVNNLPKVVARLRGGRESNSQPSSCESTGLPSDPRLITSLQLELPSIVRFSVSLYVSVCLFVYLTIRSYISKTARLHFTYFPHMLPAAVAESSSDDNFWSKWSFIRMVGLHRFF